MHSKTIFTTRIGSALLVCVVGAVCLAPFVYLLALSLSDGWVFPALLPERWTLETWRRIFEGGSALGESFLLSAGISIAVALLSTAAGFETSRFIAYHRKKRVLLFLAYVPFIMSPVILGTCLMYLYLRAGLSGTVVGVVLSQVMFAYGFAIVLFSAFWNERMRAYQNLVRTLGGTDWQVYRTVLLPLSKGMLLICLFQTFLISWFQYGLTLLIGAGKIQTLPLKVYDYVNEANVYYAAVASCLLVLPPALMILINKRLVFKPQT